MEADHTIAWAVVQVAALGTIALGVACWAHFAFRALRETTAMQRTMLEALVALKSYGSVVVAPKLVEGGPFDPALDRDTLTGSLIPQEDIG